MKFSERMTNFTTEQVGVLLLVYFTCSFHFIRLIVKMRDNGQYLSMLCWQLLVFAFSWPLSDGFFQVKFHKNISYLFFIFPFQNVTHSVKGRRITENM